MKDALINFFNFFTLNLRNPIYDSLYSTNFIKNFYNYIMQFIGGLFRLWNNDNTLSPVLIDYQTFCSSIAEFFCVIVVIFILKITISIFNVIFNSIRGHLR